MKKFWRSTAMTVLLFLLAAGLLSVGVVGGTQAALTIRSNNYYSAFDLDHIGVALLEDTTPVAWRTYTSAVNGEPNKQLDGQLTLDLGDDKEVKLGKQYPMPVAAQNTGTIDQYVRVTIHKYWVADAQDVVEKGEFHGNGTKIINDIYRPEYIQLGYNGVDNTFNTSNWIRDPGASTPEREVYYYNGILAPGATSAPLFNNISISTDVTQNAVVTVTTEGGVTKTVYTYAYDGYGFVIQAEVDAVQTHHARAAINSAWGTSAAILNQMGVPTE